MYSVSFPFPCFHLISSSNTSNAIVLYVQWNVVNVMYSKRSFIRYFVWWTIRCQCRHLLACMPFIYCDHNYVSFLYWPRFFFSYPFSHLCLQCLCSSYKEICLNGQFIPTDISVRTVVKQTVADKLPCTTSFSFPFFYLWLLFNGTLTHIKHVHELAELDKIRLW